MTDQPATICFPFVGDTIGGSHLSALTLLQAMDKQRYRPLVVVHQEGPLSHYLSEQGIAYRHLPLRRTVGRSRSLLGHIGAMLSTLPVLLRFLRRHDVAAVHSNDGRMHLTWTLPARLTGCATIWHQRNRVSGSRLEALIMGLATRMIAISRFVASGLPPRAASKATVIANPVAAPAAIDRADCKAALLQELGLTTETQVVGLFGNLIAWKRPLLFVEMAARLAKSSDKPLAFVVFGDDREGLQAAMAARAAEAGIGDRVFFMGFRSPVWDWIAACDVIVAPAEGEPFGRTLVEAMRAGTAVVAANSGGHREIIETGKTGLLVPGNDPAAYAAATARLLGDASLRDTIARHGRAAAEAGYNAGDHAGAVMAIYDDALGRSAARNGLVLVIADLDCGGAQRVLTRLAGAWADAGRRITVVTLAGSDRDFFTLPQGVRRVALNQQQPSAGLAGALWSNLRRVVALRRTIRDSRAGTVLSFVAGINILTIIATRGIACRVVISERNDPSRQSLGQPWDWLRRRVYAWADVVTANSQSAVASLRRYVPEAKLAFTPNPLDIPDTLPDDTAREHVILAAGRLDPQKGFDILLAAFARSRARSAGWRLAVLGEGPLREALAAQAAALGIADQVAWHGVATDPAQHYRRAGLFALPSRHEGTPNVLLEAMAFGVPVIVSETSGGALDFVTDGHSGLVVPTEDPAALAAAIDRLTGNPDLRRRLGIAGRRRVETCRLAHVLPLWDAILERRGDDAAMAPVREREAQRRNQPPIAAEPPQTPKAS